MTHTIEHVMSNIAARAIDILREVFFYEDQFVFHYMCETVHTLQQSSFLPLQIELEKLFYTIQIH